jgi:hypothetical protein
MAACGGGPRGLTGPANLSGVLSAHAFDVVIDLIVVDPGFVVD